MSDFQSAPAIRKQTHKVDLPVPPETAFEFLVKYAHLREWWSVSYAIVIPGEGGTWTASWGRDRNNPDYITTANISRWRPGKYLELSDYRYYARNNSIPAGADFTTRFDIKPIDEGARLIVCQSGFPDDPATDDYYKGCDEGWKRVFETLRDYAAQFQPQ